MREDLTEIICIVDKSGSMGRVKNDTIGGFNEFLENQKKEEGDANLTLVLFDTSNKVLYNGTPIQEVEPLSTETYQPGGWTGLYDAIGVGIDATLERRESMPEKEKAANVIFAILTDGEENRSEEYKGEAGRASIFEKINHQRENNWEFIFLGANQEAISSGRAIGIASDKTMRYADSSIGTRGIYSNLSAAVSTIRTTGKLNDENWKK